MSILIGLIGWDRPTLAQSPVQLRQTIVFIDDVLHSNASIAHKKVAPEELAITPHQQEQFYQLVAQDG